jgi:ABC-type lipoprotein export system ATPase subunit
MDTQPETVVRVDAVSRIYHVGETDVKALDNISLEVTKGTLVALKGRSGSGKTTLLNMIGGLDQPSHGDVFLYGQAISRMSNHQLTDLRRKKIGFVFQTFAIMPAFSAVENVELMLRIAGMFKGRRQRAIRCLEIVGLRQWANHRPWEMSGGQQQRVAIARALATHPTLILADEPTGELDSANGRQILALFRYIVEKEGVTVILATHDPMIEEYAHVVYDLGDGQIKNVHRPTP